MRHFALIKFITFHFDRSFSSVYGIVAVYSEYLDSSYVTEQLKRPGPKRRVQTKGSLLAQYPG